MSESHRAVQAEVISIGDEITSGRILDTNSQWLSLRLADELGVRVLYHTTIGDELQAMVHAFRQAIDRSDVVVTTGGLGPTADDLTRVALANAVGRPLEKNAQALEHVREIFRRRNRPMPERNEIQALFPHGAEPIANPNGTAPGIALTIPRDGREPCRFFCLPGVPVEMREMWPEVRDRLKAAGIGGKTIVRRDIKCFGAGESNIEAMLPDLIRRGRHPTVGINASKNTIILRITAEGDSEEECRRAIEPVAETIYRCLGDLVFGEGDDELEDVVVRLLRNRNRTLATTEWNTAGMLAEWLKRADGDRSVYAGGLVLARPDEVEHALHLPEIGNDLASLSTLSGAERMATETRKLFAVDTALVAAPFDPMPGSDRPRSMAVAVAGDEGVISREVALWGHPAYLTIAAAKHALNTLRLHLLDRPFP
ncbi:MAG: CinA family nicotinamide mononucleotide deamidase-related protein [Planctomycetota bacterium]|nr:MAG: CinA family nicotinamide mononucleotide deamidase-related protein [Planctomycetota bacterium]